MGNVRVYAGNEACSPVVEKSEAPSGMRRYEKPAELAPSVSIEEKMVDKLYLTRVGVLTIEEIFQQLPVAVRVLGLTHCVNRRALSCNVEMHTFRLLNTWAEESAVHII